MDIAFYKFQGTGNDFILIDSRDRVFELSTSQIAAMCHRRFGIGADGLILLQNHHASDFYMKYYNSDGRESSMCGNGGRCISAFASYLGMEQHKITFDAIDGFHEAYIDRKNKHEWYVKLKMADVNEVKSLEGQSYELHTGSPHFVKPVMHDVSSLDLIKEAKSIRFKPPYVHEGINVNFFQVLAPGIISMRTYERGVEDETLSCGTGATASAISYAILQQLASGQHRIEARVPGGVLHIDFQYDAGKQVFTNIWLSGLATLSYSGLVDSDNF